jgi:predicted nucleic acid-binding protein
MGSNCNILHLPPIQGSDQFSIIFFCCEPYASELDRLLADDEVLGHDLVYGELLIGDRGGRAKLLGAYKRMRQAASVPNPEVVEFVRHRKINGRGIGWIDAHLLASAIVAHSMLWSADRPLATAAGHRRGIPAFINLECPLGLQSLRTAVSFNYVIN